MVTSVPIADVRRKFEHPNCDRVFHVTSDTVCAACSAPIPEIRPGEPLYTCSSPLPATCVIESPNPIRGLFEKMYGQRTDESAEGWRRAELLAAALNKCREALAPFAAEAERRPWVTTLDTAGLDSANIGGCGLTNGDLRRALTATREAFPLNMQPVRFVYETRYGDQAVRLEAPTHEDLAKLIETASNTPRVKG